MGSLFLSRGNQMKLNIACMTNGRGFWSCHQADVVLHKTVLRVSDYGDFAPSFELKVYFTKRSWDIREHGLIYTDLLWMRELRERLVEMGFSKKAVKDINYSEQGMQGHDYVSLDAGWDFASEYIVAFEGKVDYCDFSYLYTEGK